MQLLPSVSNLFEQLKDLLNALTQAQYITPSVQLRNATIGQHLRHVIELFIELNNGYETGIVNYEKRKRDYYIETDKVHATSALDLLLSTFSKKDKILQLQVDYDIEETTVNMVQTNYFREVVYNIEHTVHHMALIHIAVKEIADIALPACFGVAASTIKYRNTVCVQ